MIYISGYSRIRRWCSHILIAMRLGYVSHDGWIFIAWIWSKCNKLVITTVYEFQWADKRLCGTSLIQMKKKDAEKRDGKIIGVPDSSSNVFGNKVCWSLFVLMLLYSELSVVLLPLTADCRISNGCWTGSSVSCDILLEPLPMRNFNLNGAILNRDLGFYTSNTATNLSMFCFCLIFFSSYFRSKYPLIGFLSFFLIINTFSPRKQRKMMSNRLVFGSIVFIFVRFFFVT